MDFWRSGQARTYRDPHAQRKGMTVWQRITGFHFPAWVPVAGIIVVVFGILGLLFYTRSAIGAPRIGDHWHAPYTIFIGDEQEPRMQEFITAQGIHTHGDGVIHIHPHNQAGEGNGANLGNFFGDQGGKLTNSELQIPGRPDRKFKNGDEVDGKPGELRILKATLGRSLPADFSQAINDCNAKPESEFESVNPRYVPKDGDCIRIVFGPPENPPVVQQDRTIIPDDQADREIAMDVTGSGETTVFSPASIDVKAGETVRVTLTNNSTEGFHGLRFSGADRQYGTSDDYVLPNLDPPPGPNVGSVVIRFDAAGEYEFRDEQTVEGVTPVTGRVIVGEPEATPPPDATPTPPPADLTLDITAGDTAFEPSALTVEAGKTFRIKVTNPGVFVKRVRIAGPDGQFETNDDIIGVTVNPGGTGEVSGKIDSPGTYPFRDDFHQNNPQGTLTVQ
jgi:plastocyanin